jgi:hypothetical protein
MPWVKGQSGNAKGRPKILPAIRARARVDSHAAYDRLLAALPDEKQGVMAAVQIFASDAEETKAQVEASKAVAQSTPALEEAAGSPELPLN